MQIRCASCGRAVTVAATGVLPESCPHCRQAPVPEVLGKWRIERLLAAGGMGEVYLARHRDLGSRVAIKLLPATTAGETDAMRERFKREAVLTAGIDHPGVVRVLDHDDAGERAFLVLEYLDGRSLRSVLRDAGALPWPRAIAIATAVADVLAAAHRKRVVHRDVKPENVVLTADDRVRVLDFGIARAVQGSTPLTRTGEILGTPEYMAPEQLLEPADTIDARTDVHALGVLTFELLTGRSPFAGPNLFAVLKLVESLEPPPPSRLCDGLPGGVDGVVGRALAKVPAERFAGAGEFAAALRAAAPGAAVAGVPGAARPMARPSWAWLAIAAVALIAFVAGGLAFGAGAGVSDEAGPDGSVATTAAGAGALVARGAAALRTGEFHVAIEDLERARKLGAAGAGEPAAVAWIGAHLLLPTLVGAPDWVCAVDVPRRDALLGIGVAGDEGDGPAPGDDPGGTPLQRACRRLAMNDAAGAFAVLDAGDRLQEPAASIALLAAWRACADLEVVRDVAVRLRPVEPTAMWQLLEAGLESPAALRSALDTHVATLGAGSADRWLTELALETVAMRLGEGRFARMHAGAELAWLTGAGEVAPLWLAAFRITVAAGAGESALADLRTIDRLIAPTDAAVHPAAAVVRALCAVATGDRAAVCDALRATAERREPWLAGVQEWAAACARSDQDALARWHAIAWWLLGEPERARQELSGSTAPMPPGPEGVGYVLLGAARPPGERTEPWASALEHGSGFVLLDLAPPLPGRQLPAPAAEDFATAAQHGRVLSTLLPAARACVRRGHAAEPLRAVLQAQQGQVHHEAWIREVQGGIE